MTLISKASRCSAERLLPLDGKIIFHWAHSRLNPFSLTLKYSPCKYIFYKAKTFTVMLTTF